MSFRNRLWLAFGIVLSLVVCGVCGTFSMMFFNYEMSAFKNEGQARVASAGELLRQFESASELIAENALTAWAQREALIGLESDNKLTELAQQYHVSHMYATDLRGHFLRSTNGNWKNFKASLFEYCHEYEDLLVAQRKVVHTPLVTSVDEAMPGPFKYSMVLNQGGDKILDVSISSEYLEKSILRVLAGDNSFVSLQVLAPNGETLASVAGAPKKVRGLELFRRLTSVPETMTFERNVQVTSQACCECIAKGLSSNTATTYTYTFVGTFSTDQLTNSLLAWACKVAVIYACLLAVCWLVSYWIARYLVTGLEKLADIIRNIDATGDLNVHTGINNKDEIGSLARALETMATSLKAHTQARLDAEKSIALIETASHVAHDIRAPLAALEMVAASVGAIPDDARNLLQASCGRIRSIADGLLDKRRGAAVSEKEEKPSVTCLSSVISATIEEKRAQYKCHGDLKIVTDLGANSLGLFWRIETNALQSVLSNLVGNAAEAMNFNGTVVLSLKNDGENVRVQIKDCGPGIPPHVLERLGKEEISFGKKHGNGIGLYQAYKTMERAGGKLRVLPADGTGTVIELDLKKSPGPESNQIGRVANAASNYPSI